MFDVKECGVSLKLACILLNLYYKFVIKITKILWSLTSDDQTELYRVDAEFAESNLRLIEPEKNSSIGQRKKQKPSQKETTGQIQPVLPLVRDTIGKKIPQC